MIYTREVSDDSADVMVLVVVVDLFIPTLRGRGRGRGRDIEVQSTMRSGEPQAGQEQVEHKEPMSTKYDSEGGQEASRV